MKGFGLYLIILVCLLAGVSYVVSQTQQTETLSYNQIYNYFMDGDVDQYDVDDTTLTMHLKKENQTYTYDLGDYRSVFYNDLGETIQQQMRDGTLTKVDYRTATIPWWAQFLPYVILIVLLIAFWYFMMNKQSGGGAGPMQFGKARAKLAQDDKRKVTFNDVAGADEEKDELQEIVEFLKNPQKFVQIGARIPKGVLLVGPPGTGKTLIARAVAGEAGVPFLSISGSDFVELYVGVGASRVRDLFKEATKNAPCIIFIDEIDAIGRSRDSKYGGGNEEREQTLNQLLSEMDGFDTSKGILVLGATNRPEILDKALLRPGRFDRRIIVDKPDLKGRVEILKVHAKDVKMDETVDFDAIALATSGAVGSDLANMINEAAINAVKEGREYVCQKDLFEAVEQVLGGKEKKDRIMSKEERRIVSYHEVGHALGLKHNFRGSSVFSTASLRDKEFLRNNGHGASIMDYMRFNYAVQPEDDVSLDDLIPRVGEYDCFAIEWGYRYFPSEEVARKRLWEWVDSMAQNPLYQYGGIDKTDVFCQSEDLGFNQMEVNELGIKNMQRLLQMPIWMKEQDEAAKKVMSSRYRGMLIRYQGYINQVLRNLWGVTEKRDSLGQKWEFVGMERQQVAYDFLEQYAFTPQHWLFRQDMFSYYGIDERMNWESICWSVVSGLLDKLDSPLFEKYSLGDYLKQVRSSLFREWELNEPVSEERKTLQRRYIWRLKQLAQNGKKSDCRIAIWAEMELQEILALAVKYRNTVTDKFYPESVIVGIRNCIK